MVRTVNKQQPRGWGGGGVDLNILSSMIKGNNVFTSKRLIVAAKRLKVIP